MLTSDGPDDRPAEMASHLPPTARVESIPYVAAKPGSLGFVGSLARSWVSREPVGVWKWHVPALARRARAIVDGEACDLVVADFLFAVPNVPFGRVPVVHFSHNVEHVIWKRYAALEPRPLRRLLLEVEWRKFRNAEARACRRSDLTVAVSEEDRRALAALAPEATIGAVPTGVDLEYFTPAPERERPHHVAFCGSMDWQPNEDAVCWFADEILPRVQADVPDATLAIIGRKPTPRVRALAGRRGITVTGSVDDVRPHVTSAALSVVPLRIGGGTRLKIFEALAMGQAVLSTTIGAEGLGLTPDREVAIADDAPALADATVALLRDAERRQALGRAGRRLVEARYSWTRVGDAFRLYLEQVRPHADFVTHRVAVS